MLSPMRVLCLVVVSAAVAMHGQVQTIPPSRGVLLIATERNRDAGFAETVIMLLQHDRTRSLGLVINRRLGEPVSTLFPDLRTGSAGMEPLWAGGPVALGINALVRSN